MRFQRILPVLLLAAVACLGPACAPKAARTPKSLLVIGLDGATWKLLTPWMARGDLPNLKALVDDGVSGNLNSVIPFLSPPAWTSAITGTNPGKHGVYDFLRRLPGSMTMVNITSRQRRVPAIWQLLSDAGYKVGVVNVPATDPPDAVNGFMISGMPHAGVTGYAYPPELEKELDDYRLDSMDLSIEPGHEEEMLQEILLTNQRRSENVKKLLSTHDWDFAWIVFTSTDRVQHFFWQFMDPQWPGYDAARAARLGPAVHDVWVQVDRYLGEVVALARARKGADLPILVLSDHGFGPVHREFRMQSFLRNPPGGQAPITACYACETNASNLFFSVAGREPDGVLTPAEFQAQRDEVVRRLKLTRDPETGVAPTRYLYKREELFKGRYADLGPDLVMIPTPGVYLSNDRGKREPWGTPSYSFSAHHEMEGILVATGGPFTKGRVESGASLLDITPTLLYVLGQPIPDYCDGRVLSEIITPAFQKAHPVKTAARQLPAGAAADSTAARADSLHGLPYIKGVPYIR